MRKYKLIHGKAEDVLDSFPPEIFQCCVTSPPYWQLRDYFADGQLGQEETPEEYVENLVNIFKKVKRVLRKDGVLWLNIGDSYSNTSGYNRASKGFKRKSRDGSSVGRKIFKHPEIKKKDLIGIPWKAAFALRKDGWYLRQDVIWNRPNPMPDGAKDRPTRAHEYIFQFSKSPNYFYDYFAVLEKAVSKRSKGNTRFGARNQKGTFRQDQERVFVDYGTRNKRSVWTVPVANDGKGHFAVYPDKLIFDCVKSSVSKIGCCPKCGSPIKRKLKKVKRLVEKNKQLKEVEENSIFKDTDTIIEVKEYVWDLIEDGWEVTCKCSVGDAVVPCLVLDPFNGTGTTGRVAFANKANYVGIDINKEYIEITRNTFKQDMFNEELEDF